MKMRVLRLITLAAMAGGLAACFVGSALETASVQPVGSVEIHSTTLGDVVFVPTLCTSGERQVFLGADFSDDHDHAARLFIQPDGSAGIRFFAPSHSLRPGLVFNRQECEPFHLSLERTGWRVNDIYDIGVTLDFSCRNSSGESAQGKLSVEHCH